MPRPLVDLTVLAACVFTDDGAGVITLRAAQGIQSVVFGAGPPPFYDITPDPEIAGGFPTDPGIGFLPDARVISTISGGGSAALAISSSGSAWRVEITGAPFPNVPIWFALRRMTLP